MGDLQNYELLLTAKPMLGEHPSLARKKKRLWGVTKADWKYAFLKSTQRTAIYYSQRGGRKRGNIQHAER